MTRAAPRIWVLSDGRAGNDAQSLGVAEKLGLSFETKKLDYTPLSRLPNLVLGASLAGLTARSRAQLSPPWPDVVIAAGRRLAPAALHIKRQSPETRLVQIMWPQGRARRFDCIVLPAHDATKVQGNVFRVHFPPHRLTQARLTEAKLRVQPQVASLPKPYVAVLIGGSTKQAPFTLDDYRRLAELACAEVAGGGSLLVTTSRRTGPEGLNEVKQRLTVPHALYEYGAAGDNPYLGYLALAECIIVTGESMAMCAEACFTGKPVYVFAPAKALSAKHRRMHQLLYDNGWAAPLGAAFTVNRGQPEDAATQVASHIRRQLLSSF